MIPIVPTKAPKVPTSSPLVSHSPHSSHKVPVVSLCLCAQDVAGPHVIAYNLPNDERIQKERGTAMVMLKNVSEAK